LLSAATTLASAHGGEPSTPVEAGDVLDRATASGQVDRYALALEAGQFVHAVVDQPDVADITLSIEDPAGRTSLSVDRLSSITSPLAFVASEAGQHVLVVRAAEAKPGARYRLRIEAVRPPGEADLLLARTVRAMADSEPMLGSAKRHREGLSLLQTSLEGWRALGHRNLEMWTAIYMGSIHRVHLEEYRESIALVEQGLAIARELRDERAQTTALFNLGSASWRLADFDGARKYFEDDLAIHRAAGRIPSVAYLLTALGRMHTAAGELDQALDRLHEALGIYRTHPTETAGGDDEPDPVAILHSHLAAAYAALGDDALALAEFGKARDLLPMTEAVLGRPELALHIRGLRARMTTGMGTARLGLGDLPGARRDVTEALAGYRELGRAVNEVEARLLLADVEAQDGRLEAARQELLAAIEVLRSRGVRVTEAEARCRLGEIERRLGQREAARAAFVEAGATAGAQSVAVTTCVEAGLARLALDAGDPRGAQAYAENAIRVAESMRASAGSRQARAASLASRQGLYELLVDARMRRHAAEPQAGHDVEALAVSEQARARGLLDLLGETTLDVRAGADEALLASEQALRRRLNAHAEALQQAQVEGRAERAAALDREITDLCAELADLEVRIRRSSPRYAALTQPRTLTAQEIQREVLDADTLLLEYALGESASHLWVVSSMRVRSYLLPPRDAIEAAAHRAYEAFVTPASRRPPGTDQAAAELGRMLLGPAVDALDRPRLLIVAPGLLQYLPFGALPDPRSGATPLLARHEIVTAASASVVAAARREGAAREAAPMRVAVLADPVYERDDPRVARSASSPAAADSAALANARALRRGSGVRLGRLPFSRYEADAIAKLLPAARVSKHLGFQATRERAASGELGRFRVLHFATHGVLDTQHPELSGLVLSLLDHEGNARDGFLRLHDVYNLRLGAELVVLSGCRTALGKDVRGEGLVGLTRGFLYAGARRVVASLWQVDDRATSELMARFYRALIEEGLTPAAALRQAQLSMARSTQWRDDYYWAGFVVQGDW
jgi:CHAT domain-containing protein